MTQINYGAIFDGNDLTAVSGLTVLGTDGFRPPKRRLNSYPILRTDKSRTTSGFFDKKTITVKVGISRASRDLAEQSLDALLVLLQGLGKELVLAQSGKQRKFYCSLQDTVSNLDGGSYVQLDLIFECNDRFGYDTAPTLLVYGTANTSAPYTAAVNVGGSAQWQAPVYTFTLGVLTGGTAKNVIIGNQTTGQYITITRTWAAGDLIEIDCFNKTVKVNGTEVAWTGAWPYLAPGSATIYYTDTLTTRSMTAQVTNVNRYL